MFIWTFLLRITHTIISQSYADSSWITLYIYIIIRPSMDIAIYHYLFLFFVSHFCYLFLIPYLSPLLYVSFSLPRFFHLPNFLSAYILYFCTDTNLISLPCSVSFCDRPISITPYITFSQGLIRTLCFPFLILCATKPRITKLFSKMEWNMRIKIGLYMRQKFGFMNCDQ